MSHNINNQNTKKRERNDDLPTGVCASRRFGKIVGYRAQWNDMTGKLHKAYFGIRKWNTLEAALIAAVTRRNLEMSKLKSQGASYTERHGL